MLTLAGRKRALSARERSCLCNLTFGESDGFPMYIRAAHRAEMHVGIYPEEAKFETRNKTWVFNTCGIF